MNRLTLANFKTSKVLFATLILVMSLAVGASKASDASTERTKNMKIKIAISGKTLVVADNETARDFISLLPLKLSMNDLFGREKYGDLPKALSENGARMNRTKSAISLIGLRITSSLSSTVKMESRYLRPA